MPKKSEKGNLITRRARLPAGIREAAQRIANWNLVPYRVFLDASRTVRIERFQGQPESTWSGSKTIAIVYPQPEEELRKDPILKERHDL